MLSKLNAKDAAGGGNFPPEDAVIALIDQIIRVAGRLATARKMTRAVAGMRTAHWLLLTAVCRASRPPTVARVSRSFGQSRQALQRIANALAEHGLVQFIDDPADRRAKVMVATPRGRDAFALADREGGAWAANLAKGLSLDRIADAALLLDELRRRLERDARSGGHP